MKIRDLELRDLDNNLLKSFNRYQEIKKAWFFKNNELVVYKINEKYDWDDNIKLKIIDNLRDIILSGGFIIGIFDEEKLIAFAAVDGQKFGVQNDYVELRYIHVSYEYRYSGVGSNLFSLVKERVIDNGDNKIYISANPSEESQMFYKKRGCVLAKEINHARIDEEPYDCQLEYVINS